MRTVVEGGERGGGVVAAAAYTLAAPCLGRRGPPGSDWLGAFKRQQGCERMRII